MAPGYPSYGNYYDPAGSQGYTPTQSHTYQQRTNAAPQYAESTSSAAAQPSSYSTTYPSENAYSRGWYGSNAQAGATTENRAAETLNLLATQEHGQYAPNNRTTAPTASYESSGWTSSNQAASQEHTAATSHSHAAPVSHGQQRSTGITSPVNFRPQPNTSRPSESSTAYTSTQTYQQPDTNTRYSYGSYGNSDQYQPAHQQTTSTNVGTTHYTPNTATQSSAAQQYRPDSPYQQSAQQPARAPSAQSITRPDKSKRTSASRPSNNENHARSVSDAAQSRANTLTPTSIQQQVRNAAARYTSTATRDRQSESVDSSAPVTVDPTQVYDPWPEQQRKAQEAAEKRKKLLEAEQARKDAERRELESKQREQAAKEFEEKLKAAEESSRVRAAETTQNMEAAKALASAATSAAIDTGRCPGETELEAQMRQMFQKMREFNSANPELLAKLWEEERQAHLSSSPAAASPAATPAVAPQGSASETPAGRAGSGSKTAKSSKPSKPRTPAGATQSNGSTTKNTLTQPTGTSVPDVPNGTSSSSKSAPTANSSLPTAHAIWPPGKKHQLAEAAAKWLNMKNRNLGKNVSVTPGKIVTMLDPNPSYITLCEKLESVGLTVDRAAFARSLLQAVPDVSRTGAAATSAPNSINPELRLIDSNANTTSAQPASSTTTRKDDPPAQPNVGAKRNSSIELASGTPKPGAQSSPSLTELYTNAVGQTLVPYESQPSMGYGTPAGMQAAARNAMPPPPLGKSSYFQQQQQQPSYPPPRNKVEAARKRNISELMDLTGDDSDDDIQFVSSTLNEVQQFPGFDSGDSAPNIPDVKPLEGPSQQVPASVLQDNSQSAYKSKPSTREAELSGKILAQPIRREKVARKSRYDPRTIARDVLLATGRHPEMRTLNQHLMGMQGVLQKHSQGVFMNNFDLGTIRWDLIDPGDPVDGDDDEDDDKDIDMDADDESDGLTEQAAPIPSRQQINHEDGTVSIVELGTPGLAFKGPQGFKKRRGRPPKSGVFGTGVMQARPGITGTPRRGRPSASSGLPGSGIVQSRPPGFGDTLTRGVSLGHSQQSSKPTKQNSTQAASTDTPTNSDRAAGAFEGNEPAPSSTPVGYAAFNQSNIQLDESGKPVKRRGRPVGWRKNVHSKAAQGLGSGGSPSSLPNRARKVDNTTGYDQVKRRQRKSAKTGQDPPDPDAEFNVYKCKWQGCTAELHNLDTLRKHILKIHGQPSKQGTFVCLWRGCGLQDDLIGKGKKAAQQEDDIGFDQREDWMGHIEHDHIQELARTLGDGPRSGLSDAHDFEQSEAYLSDATGRMITPRATVMESVAEYDVEQESSLAAVYRQGMPRVRGRLSIAQQDDELRLQHLEAKKKAIGPFIDRGGSTLANDHRRRGFYDDEDFEGEVSADDGP